MRSPPPPEGITKRVQSIKQLRDALRAGAVLTMEESHSPTGCGTYSVTDEYVLREPNGKPMLIVGAVVSRAIHAGKLRSVQGSQPIRYEFKAQSDE